MTTYFPTMRRINDGNLSRIEPPLNPAWDDLTRFQWKAATIRIDHGIQPTVEPDTTYAKRVLGVWVKIPNHYQVQGMAPCPAREVWAILNGFMLGLEAVKRVRA